MPEQPDPQHTCPDDVDDDTVIAVGRLSEGFEFLIRARGALYTFHQLMGRADALFDEAAELLRTAGHDALAHELSTTLVGRNVLPDQWTFEVVESFDDTYFDVAEHLETRIRESTLGGRRHVHESQMKARRREDGPSDDRG